MLTVTVTTTAAGHSVVVNLPQSHVAAAADHRGRRSEPDRPRSQRVGVGRRLVHRAVRAHAPRALPPFEEGDGCPLRKDPRRSRDRRADSRRSQGRSCRVRGGAGDGQGRGSPANRRRPPVTLEDERTAALAEANARIAARRAEAMAATEAARAAAAEHIQAAVVDVSSRVTELATGRRPDAAAVTSIVSSLMAGGGA